MLMDISVGGRRSFRDSLLSKIRKEMRAEKSHMELEQWLKEQFGPKETKQREPAKTQEPRSF